MEPEPCSPPHGTLPALVWIHTVGWRCAGGIPEVQCSLMPTLTTLQGPW